MPNKWKRIFPPSLFSFWLMAVYKDPRGPSWKTVVYNTTAVDRENRCSAEVIGDVLYLYIILYKLYGRRHNRMYSGSLVAESEGGELWLYLYGKSLIWLWNYYFVTYIHTYICIYIYRLYGMKPESRSFRDGVGDPRRSVHCLPFNIRDLSWSQIGLFNNLNSHHVT